MAVILEDLFLGEALLEFEGDDHLGQLAAPALIRSVQPGIQPEHAGELLAEGGSALLLAAFAEIDVSGFDDADGVEAGVLKEALILGRGKGVHHYLGDVGELDDAALLAAGAGDVGNELRFELVLEAGGVIAERDDLRDFAAGEFDEAGLLLEVGIGARENLYGVRMQLIVTNWVMVRIGIPAAAQFGGDGDGSGDVADGYRFGGGENLGGIRKRAGAQFLVDQPGVLGVKERKNPDSQHKGDR